MIIVLQRSIYKLFGRFFCMYVFWKSCHFWSTWVCIYLTRVKLWQNVLGNVKDNYMYIFHGIVMTCLCIWCYIIFSFIIIILYFTSLTIMYTYIERKTAYCRLCSWFGWIREHLYSSSQIPEIWEISIGISGRRSFQISGWSFYTRIGTSDKSCSSKSFVCC